MHKGSRTSTPACRCAVGWLALVATLFSAAAFADAEPARPGYLFWDEADVLRVRFGYAGSEPPVVQLYAEGRLARTIRARKRPFDGVQMWQARIGQSCRKNERIDVDAMRLPGNAETIAFTLPPCAPDSTIRVSLIADTQMDTQAVREVLAHSRAFAPDGYVIAGDLVQRGGAEGQWTRYFAALAPIMQRRVVLTVPGNHEYYASDDARPYRRYFATTDGKPGELWRDVAWGPIRFFLLDSTVMLDDDRADAQRRWFAQRLADTDVLTDGRWRVVVLHHPPYSSSVAHIPVYFTRHQQAVRRDYVPLFERRDVALVFGGHVHLFERSEKAGVHYLNAGPAGGLYGFSAVENPVTVHARAQIRTVTNLRADACTMTLQTRDRIGVLADAVTLRRPCAPRRAVGRREVSGRRVPP